MILYCTQTSNVKKKKKYLRCSIENAHKIAAPISIQAQVRSNFSSHLFFCCYFTFSVFFLFFFCYVKRAKYLRRNGMREWKKTTTIHFCSIKVELSNVIFIRTCCFRLIFSYEKIHRFCKCIDTSPVVRLNVLVSSINKSATHR